MLTSSNTQITNSSQKKNFRANHKLCSQTTLHQFIVLAMKYTKKEYRTRVCHKKSYNKPGPLNAWIFTQPLITNNKPSSALRCKSWHVCHIYTAAFFLSGVTKPVIEMVWSILICIYIYTVLKRIAYKELLSIAVQDVRCTMFFFCFFLQATLWGIVIHRSVQRTVRKDLIVARYTSNRSQTSSH